MHPGYHTVALAGNPNTGKSTVFNNLTGYKQHTGNWPGKTVGLARGFFTLRSRQFEVVDLPGTYSLSALSEEEEIARDFICFGGPEVIVVVVDATCLERNLSFVLNVMEVTPKVVVCLNLMDEAVRRKIEVDADVLSEELRVPVVPCSARDGRGMDTLKNAICEMALTPKTPVVKRISYGSEVEKKIDRVVRALPSHMRTVDPRWIALRLLYGDTALVTRLEAQEEYTETKNMVFGRGITGRARIWNDPAKTGKGRLK